MRSIPKT